MATHVGSAERWESTSVPVLSYDKSKDSRRVELNYTAKKKRSVKKRSPRYATREEAEGAASWFRLSVEQGNNGKSINPGTQPDPPSSTGAGSSPADAGLPPGKSRRSMSTLNVVQERQYKKQRREGSSLSRGEWMKSTLLTSREKRCLERAWSTRKARLEKHFQNRHAYLKSRVRTLKERVEKNAGYINRLRSCLVEGVGTLLYSDDQRGGEDARDAADA